MKDFEVPLRQTERGAASGGANKWQIRIASRAKNMLLQIERSWEAPSGRQLPLERHEIFVRQLSGPGADDRCRRITAA